MLFSSIPFLYYFLPCFLILYFAAPRKLKNAVMLLGSLVFYAWGEPKYVFLMAASILAGYIFGLLIEKYRGTRAAKILLVVSVAFNLVLLGYFKYADFFIDTVNSVFRLEIPLLKVALPIGISFYTFQILSYSVDVYRGDTKAQRNIVDLAAYVASFPQLIAGPIVRYTDIEVQLASRRHSFEKTAEGVRRFVIGLAKKILIANALGELCDVFRAGDERSVMFYWLYAVAFSLHIYFDFSGYSDMAIGLGKILGFEFLENFNYPYISSSVTEFWRRWHISLGSWFRDYVYIPLGGNRVSKPRWFLNIFIVWMLTGFWHGAAWNFVVWGLWFAFFLIMEKLWLGKLLEKTKITKHIYVLVTVVISFVIFNAADMSEAIAYIGGMFGAGGISFVDSGFVYNLRSYGLTILAACVFATPLVKNAVKKLRSGKTGARIVGVAEPVVLGALVILMTAFLVDGSFNPFLYFRF
ncbi:MAG: MBOAT family protein [Clostridiales bacterium]|nr:MBOAT family protein [Clostridiales bacterium]